MELNGAFRVVNGPFGRDMRNEGEVSPQTPRNSLQFTKTRGRALGEAFVALSGVLHESAGSKPLQHVHISRKLGGAMEIIAWSNVNFGIRMTLLKGRGPLQKSMISHQTQGHPTIHTLGAEKGGSTLVRGAFLLDVRASICCQLINGFSIKPLKVKL